MVWLERRSASSSSQARSMRIGGHHQHRNYFMDPTPMDGAVLVPMYSPYVPTYSPDVQGMFGTSFQIKAHIYNPAVRYRQYVKGKYLYDGLPQPHQLHHGPLSTAQFLEDWNERGSYGDRAKNKPGLSVYRRSTDGGGDQFDIFMANDSPSDFLRCPAGTVVVIDLTFLGELVDTTNGQVHDQRQWRVFGSYKKPGGQQSTLVVRS